MTKPIKTLLFAAVMITASFCNASPVTESQITAASQNAQNTYNNFLNYTIQQRLLWHYAQIKSATLHDTASETASKLIDICTRQKALTQQIEEYEGQDWDKLYGQTNLWKKAKREIRDTLFYANSVLFFKAVTSDTETSLPILQSIVNQYTSESIASTSYSQMLLKARALAAINTQDSKQQLNQTLLLLSTRSDTNTPLYYSVFTFELQDNPDLQEVTKEYQIVKMHGLENDFELNARFALVCLKAENDTILREVVNKWPQTKSMFADIILADIKNKPLDTLKHQTPFAIELAVSAIDKENSQDNIELLKQIEITDKLRTPQILSGIANIQKQSNPQAAIKNFMDAAEKSQDKNTASDLALKAALLACNLYKKDMSQQDMVEETLFKYIDYSGSNINKDVLKFLVFIQRMKDDLIMSATLLCEYADPNDCSLYDISLSTLTQITENIEPLTSQTKVFDNIYSAKSLTQYCLNCAGNELNPQISLMLAELLTYSNDQNNFIEAEQILQKYGPDDLNSIRVKALLLTAQNQYQKAIMEWEKIANSDLSAPKDDPQWWQSKYYIIYCFSKLNPDSPQKTTHAIEILLNSSENAPDFWKNRLSKLKSTLSKQKLD